MSKMKSDCQIMVFRPTMEEFKDFSRYIQYMESQGAHRAGIAKDVSVWNVAKLNTLLDIIEMDSGVKIEGVNTAYLYFGMWKTTFAWHTEDMDLYSINYVHFGAPKSWYAVAPEHGKRLERLAAGFFPNSKSNCSAFLRHKMTLLSPSILRQYGIPVNKITQEAGEFIITFPYGYHAGFNHGFNCAESTNFASQRWIDYGKIAGRCTCRTDTVSIDMDIFVQIFQPDQYEAWQENRAEVKLTYVETPPVPDLSKSYPDWRERVFQHRSESCASKSLPKSPSKEKKKKSTDCKCVTTTVQEFGTSPYPEQSPAFSCSGDTNPHSSETTPRGYNTEFESLFDRIKGGARRMSSAKAISHEDDINSNITTMLSDKDTPSHPTCPAMSSTLSKELTFPNEDDLKISSCSVVCKPLATLPLDTTNDTIDSTGNYWELKLLLNCPNIQVPSHGNRNSINKRANEDNRSPKKLSRRKRVPLSFSTNNRNTTRSFVGVDMGSVKKEEEDPILSSFKDEREYNRNAAKAFPYCAICTLFKASRNVSPNSPMLSMNLMLEPPPHLSPPVVAGEKTKPLIPEVSFVSSVAGPTTPSVCKLLDERGESVLLQCCVCCVQVHASCYGATSPNTGEVWTCDRCMDRSWSTQCSLCCMRGGAFKPVNADSIWAHVVCAVAIPEVYFEQPGNRSSINISKIQSKRLKLKCIYCKDSPSEDYGVCLQCCTGNCTVSFHVTCAQVAGVAIEPGNWPYPVYAYCHQHAFMPKNVELEMKKSMVRLNQRVVAKLSNGKYRGGVVTDVEDEIFHKVHFKDNSWSDNLYPQDILDHDWSSGEFPEVGKRVHVKWTDGDIYEAEYKGHSENQLITVKLDDGSSHEVERNDVFTKTDHCSQKIKRKLQRKPSKLKKRQKLREFEPAALNTSDSEKK
uniref:[histone H3]-trimethyl-L-lysine(9) demethylase n=1 Tax=Ciona savignyi TaxID=51511 RepID=H2Z696_CIOSA